MAIATLIRMPSVVGRYALTLNRTPPLSVAYLAGSLTAAGHEVQVIDAVGEDIGAMHPGYRDDIVIRRRRPRCAPARSARERRRSSSWSKP